MVLLLVVIICFKIVWIEGVCSPELHQAQGSVPKIGGVIYVACKFASCNRTRKITFQKKVSDKWTSVYHQGKNGRVNRGINKYTGYTLSDRSIAYFKFNTKHVLKIDPVKLDDHGEWRCVVTDVASSELKINIYVRPSDMDLLRVANNFDIVPHQEQEFTCTANNVNPKPTLIWKLNGEQVLGEVGHPVRNDCLWSVMSTVRLTLDEPGKVKLECVMSAGEKEAWIQDSITLRVLETAQRTVIPEADPIITPASPEIVTYQTQTLICEIDGIHTEPDVLWVMNNTTYIHGKADNSQHEDGLWSVKNTIEFQSSEAGLVVFVCLIKTGINGREMTKGITFDIKEAAKVIYPTQKSVHQLSPNSTLLLECVSSGYNHRTSWRKNGRPVTDTDKYITRNFTTGSGLSTDKQYTSTLSFKLTSNDSQCQDFDEYVGVYTCVVELDPPYHSRVISPKTAVSTKLETCRSNTTDIKNERVHESTCNCTMNLVEDSPDLWKAKVMVALIVVTSAAVAALIITYAVCCYKKCNRKPKKDKRKEYYNTNDYYLYSYSGRDGSAVDTVFGNRQSNIYNDILDENRLYEELD